jgi:hypothetical protein
MGGKWLALDLVKKEKIAWIIYVPAVRFSVVFT